jgi:hypothetical protein
VPQFGSGVCIKNGVMLSTDETRRVMDKEQLERKFKELHEYVRHVFQLFIGWYTFFVTVNYASMGWLATSADAKPSLAKFAWLIPVMFISQNALGIFACLYVWQCLKESNDKILRFEQIALPNDMASTSVPILLYSRSIGLIASSLVFIIAVWSAILFFLTLR